MDTDVQAAFAVTLVDEWVRGGVAHAVVCPGSRSTPLALALAADRRITVHVRLDERSAGFSALGVGLATGRPAVVLTTSGTAAAELHAAVVEADLARVPLLVCTADRPIELQGVGAPQTIDQHRLFGGSVRWFADPGVADLAARSAWRSWGSRALVEATAGPKGPGPVHLNLSFREPLLGHSDRGGVPHGRPAGAPWHRVARGTMPPPDEVVDRIVDVARGGGRGLVVAGAGCGEPAWVAALARVLGWPVLAEPRSEVRAGGSGIGPGHGPGEGLAEVDEDAEGLGVIGAADAILRSDRFRSGHRPDLVLTLGAPWASKVVNGFVADAARPPDGYGRGGAEVIAVDPWWAWIDPDRMAATVVVADPTELCRAVVARVGAAGTVPLLRTGAGEGRPWIDRWERAEVAAQWAVDGTIEAAAGWSEPALARRLTAGLPPEATLVVSSSMPIRDIEAFAAPRPGFPRVVANRGANGIDGVVSTGLGVAWATGRPTVALVGDLAFLHDVSALVRMAGDVDVPYTVVVADNRGGGIFSFLPAANLDPRTFDTLFGTPPEQDVAEVAAGFGLPVEEVTMSDGPDALSDALGRCLAAERLSVVRVEVPDRRTNVTLHAEIHKAAVDAVDALDALDALDRRSVTPRS